ncbi:hypothetical protein EGW08_022030, partial [Elysia chlorotica]
DRTSLASQQTSTDSGVFNSLPPSATASATNSTNSSPTSSNSRQGGIMLRNSSTGSSGDRDSGGSVNGGKGLKVHFREDSFGGNSSGYGSMSSNKGGARPKVMTAPQPQVKLSAKKLKEMKKQEKKRKQEEKRKEKVLSINNNSLVYGHQPFYIPQGADVRDVTVVPLHEGRMARI